MSNASLGIAEPEKKSPGARAGAPSICVERESDYSLTTLTKVFCSSPRLRNTTRPSAVANRV